MEPTPRQQWFLRKHEDGNIFGPLPFGTLVRWASAARVAPHDSVSTDQSTWMKAPMLPDLGMDWLVEVTSERYYGPTTIGAIQEFMRLGEINEQSFVINTCDGTRRKLEQLEIAPPVLIEAEAPGESGPAAEGMSLDPQVRIRELEEALREERRALAEAEERYRKLQASFEQEKAQECHPERSEGPRNEVRDPH